MIQTKSRSEEKGVYVAGMLKIGEKKLFIVVSDLSNYASCRSPLSLCLILFSVFFFYHTLHTCRTSPERCMNKWRAVY